MARLHRSMIQRVLHDTGTVQFQQILPFQGLGRAGTTAAKGALTMKAIMYLIGTLILLVGILYGASVAGVPQTWLIVIGLVIGGLGVMGAARSATGTTKATETTTGGNGAVQTRETTVSKDAL